VGEWGEREGGREKKAGRSSLAGKIRVCPARLLREEGGRCQVYSKLRELLMPIQR